MGIKARTAQAATTTKSTGGRKPAATKRKTAGTRKAAGARKTAGARAARAETESTAKAAARRRGGRAKSAIKTVDQYVASLNDWRGEAVSELRRLVREAAPEAEEAVKWAQPVFSQNGPFCYIKAFPKHVNLGFWRGKELDDPEQRLASGGKKMAHIKVASLEDIHPEAIAPLVAQAVELNLTLGNPTK